MTYYKKENYQKFFLENMILLTQILLVVILCVYARARALAHIYDTLKNLLLTNRLIKKRIRRA
jgi:hypothetical protein